MITLTAMLLVTTGLLALAARSPRLRQEERGEGVVSVAIAVLMLALLGGILFGLFRTTLGNADRRVNETINNLGT